MCIRDSRDCESLVIAAEQRRKQQKGIRTFLKCVCTLIIFFGALTSLMCSSSLNNVFNFGYTSWNVASSAVPGIPSTEETAFLKALETNYAGNWSKEYTSVPHLAGQGLKLVNWTAEKFTEYGLLSLIHI